MLSVQYVLIILKLLKQVGLIKILCSHFVMIISGEIIKLIKCFVHSAVLYRQHLILICQLLHTIIKILSKTFCNFQRFLADFGIIHIFTDINQSCQNLMQIIVWNNQIIAAFVCSGFHSVNFL